MFQPFGSPRMNNSKLALSQKELRVPMAFENWEQNLKQFSLWLGLHVDAV